MTGFYLDGQNGRFVTCNGFQVSIRNNRDLISGDFSVVIPGYVYPSLKKIVGNMNSKISVCRSKRHIVFKHEGIGTFTYYAKILEGVYLDVQLF